ncbi:hypothetical protein L7F22_060105 [Adiantum nelumboides]|nr:hypothetical protein [Adiantum nelumboides]
MAGSRAGTFKQLNLNSWILARSPPVPSEVQQSGQDARRQMFDQLFGETSSTVEGNNELIATLEESNEGTKASTSKPKLEVEVNFLQLLKIEKADAETIYNSIIKLLADLKLDTKRFVAIATDGCSTMTGKKTGVVARLKRLFPSLIAIHCIAHREALAAKDAADQFAKMEYLDKLAGQVYTWLGKSGNRHAEFSKLLKEFQIHYLKILQLHKVRWLSRDVLEQMNILSKIFQENIVDVSTLGSTFQKTKNILKTRYLDPQSEFAKESNRLSKFIKGTSSIGFMGFKTIDDGIKSFPITWRSIRDQVTGENAENAELGSLEDCKDIAKQHVQRLLQALDTRLGDLEVFKAMKFFEPVGYPDFVGRRCESTSLWLKTLFEHFTVGAVDPLKCYAEREGFVETLYNACPHKSMLGA